MNWTAEYYDSLKNAGWTPFPWPQPPEGLDAVLALINRLKNVTGDDVLYKVWNVETGQTIIL